MLISSCFSSSLSHCVALHHIHVHRITFYSILFYSILLLCIALPELKRKRPIQLLQPSIRLNRGLFSLNGLVAHLRTLLPKDFDQLEKPLGTGSVLCVMWCGLYGAWFMACVTWCVVCG